MSNHTHPRALSIVAWLTIASGVGSVFDMLVAPLLGHSPTLALGVLDIWLGRGLLAHRRWAYDWSRFLTAVGVVLCAVVLFVVLVFRDTVTATVFGMWTGPVNHFLGAVPIIVALVLTAWEYRVLGRADVRSLFHPVPRGGTDDGSSATPLLVGNQLVVDGSPYHSGAES
ncbi:MAG TPA: hypothetical protein VIK25_00160 [Gemmatimonadaceae bacterium]